MIWHKLSTSFHPGSGSGLCGYPACLLCTTHWRTDADAVRAASDSHMASIQRYRHHCNVTFIIRVSAGAGLTLVARETLFSRWTLLCANAHFPELTLCYLTFQWSCKLRERLNNLHDDSLRGNIMTGKKAKSMFWGPPEKRLYKIKTS